MIKLYSFGSSFGVMDPSPFVVKVDTFLRMSGLPYDVIPDFHNIKKSPKGKLPFIEDDGNKIADSSFINDYLIKKYDLSLDAFLTTEQKALSYLLTKSIDENLYWCLVYSRWIADDTWPLISNTFFSKLPWPLKLFLPALIRKGVKKNLHGQGIGRHSKSEILEITKQSFSALSAMLAEQSYFFGDKPCSFDATVYASLCEFISVDYDNDFNRLAKKYDNLVRFCQRIEHTYY